MIRKSLVAAVCALTALSTLALGELATAQSAQSGVLELEEVLVTSRRVEERLQDVPVAITAFTAEALEKQAIRSVSDLANFTPNMTFTGGVAGRAAVPVVRGIGLIDGRGFDNAVGVFVDGIFVSGRAAQNAGMLDLERVEIVKGPQSALYGRNTFSGAINYVTRQTPDELTAKLEATAATDDLLRVSGSLGGRVNDWMSARVALSWDDDEGTYSNAGPLGAGDGIGGGETKAGLLSLRFTPSENVKIDVTAFYSDEFGDNRPLSRVANNCGQLDPMLAVGANAPPLSIERTVPIYYCGEGPPNGSDRISMSPDAYSFDNETRRGSISLQWDLPGVSIQSLSAYTTAKSLSQYDLDRTQLGDAGYGYVPLATYRAFVAANPGSFVPVCPRAGTIPLCNQVRTARFNTYFSPTGLDTDYWTSELRFTGSRENRLRWLGGLFYFRSKNDDTTLVGIDASEAVRTLGLPTSQIQFLFVDTNQVIPGVAPMGTTFQFPTPVFPPNALFLDGPGTALATYTPLTDIQKSVFGSLEFDFTERLTGTVEARYTKEEQDLNNIFDNYFGGRGRFTADSSFTDPRVTLRFKSSEDLMLYASAARGTRSGGINALITDPAFLTFKPEKNDTFELGVKSTLADGRVQLNASVFLIDWTDAQFRQTAPGSTGSGTLVTATTNAGNVESQGLEVSLLARVTEQWTVDGSVGFSDPKFKNGTYSASLEPLCRTLLGSAATTIAAIPISCVGRDLDNNGTVDRVQPDLSGNQLPSTSKVTANLGVEYAVPVLGDSRLVTRIDASYRSKRYGDFVNVTWAPARTLANLRVGLERENYDLFLWAENVTDEDAVDEVSPAANTNLAGSILYSTTGINPTRRRVGLTGRYRF
jgi:iron complex outermembrane recepter protein